MWTPDGYKEPKAITITPSDTFGTVTITKNNSYVLNDRITLSLKGTITLNQDVGSYGAIVLIGSCKVDGAVLGMSIRYIESANFMNAISRVRGVSDYTPQRLCYYEDGLVGFMLTTPRTSGQTLDFVIDKSFPIL